MEPLEAPRFLRRQPFADWASKVRTALKLLDLLEELESVFEEGPLFLCDVKMDHFGISDHGRVKVIDSDSAGFQSVIGNLNAILYCCT